MFIPKTFKPLQLATAVTAVFLAFTTLTAPVSSLFSVQTQADTLSAINSPEAYLTVNGKTNSNSTVEGYASYGYLASKLPVTTDYAISGLIIAVNGIIKGETLNLACDSETPKVISEITDYCSDNFYNQLLALENLNNNKNTDKAKQIKPVLKNTDNTKLQEAKKDVKKKNLLEKLLNNGSNSIKISSLSLQGSLKTLESIKTQISKDFNKAIVDIQYTTTQELKTQQKQFDDKINDKVTKEKKSKEQATKEVAEELISKLSKEEQAKLKELQSQKPLSQNVITNVESIRIIDESTGNIVLSQDKLNKLKLDKDDEKTVKLAIGEFNKLSIAEKNNLSNLLKVEGRNIASATNSKAALVDGLVTGVKTEAIICNAYTINETYWWGIKTILDHCGAVKVSLGFTLVSIGASAFGPFGWLVSAYSGVLAAFISANDSVCGNGAILYRTWNSGWWVGSRC